MLLELGTYYHTTLIDSLQCFSYHYIGGGALKVKLIYFNFIFHRAHDHNRSSLRVMPFPFNGTACSFIKETKPGGNTLLQSCELNALSDFCVVVITQT